MIELKIEHHDYYVFLKDKCFDGLEIVGEREKIDKFIGYVNKLIQALNPRLWSDEQDKDWHRSIPDMYKAFGAISPNYPE